MSSHTGSPDGASALWGSGDAEGLGHHLRGGRRAEELAAASRGAAGAAREDGRLLEAHEAVGEARAERLDRAPRPRRPTAAA